MTKSIESIAIIGAGGQMGKWLAGYFVKKGFEVTGFDIENPIPSNINKAESLISAILNKEYVLLSTPTKKTPEIIRLIAKEMRRESYLIDITSQKSKTATALGKIPAKVCPVCIHPMFGPGAKGVKGQKATKGQKGTGGDDHIGQKGTKGGTGGVGTHLLKYLLDGGHSVRVLVRNPDKLKDLKEHPKLEVLTGSSTNEDDVKKLCDGMDIVVSCLGGPLIMASSTEETSIITPPFNILAKL